MPKPFGYTRSRHYLMQAVMWLIFAATLGLAALANRSLQSAGLKLGDRIDLQSVSVRLPATWKYFDRSADSLFAAEAVGSPSSRFLSVEEHQAGFLERMFFGNASNDSPLRDRRSRKTQTISMGPITGTLSVSTQAQPISFDGGEIELGAGRAVITARGQLEPGHTIIIALETLSTENDIDPDDIDLVKRVAASIKPIEDETPQMSPR